MIIMSIFPFLLVTITVLRMPEAFPMDEKRIAKEGIEPDAVEMTPKEMGLRSSYDASNDLVARRRSTIKVQMDALGLSPVEPTEKQHSAPDVSDARKRLSLLVVGKGEVMVPIDEEGGVSEAE